MKKHFFSNFAGHHLHTAQNNKFFRWKTKYMKQSKWIENFDISFCVIFDRYQQSLISGRESRHQTLFPTNFKIFSNLSLLSSLSRRSLVTREEEFIFCAVWLKIVAIKVLKILRCFNILYSRLSKTFPFPLYFFDRDSCFWK